MVGFWCFLIFLTSLPPKSQNAKTLTIIHSLQVNSLLGDLAKGNSRLQLVNIDTGFVQVSNKNLCGGGSHQHGASLGALSPQSHTLPEHINSALYYE